MPVNQDVTKSQLHEIKAAKEAALEASKATMKPSIKPGIPAEIRTTEL